MSDAPPTEETPAAPAEEAEVVERDEVREALLPQITAKFGDAVLGSHIARGDIWVRVANERWVEVVEFCKTTLGCRFFDFLSGLDWLNNPNLSGEKTFDPDADKVPAETVAGYAGGDTRFQVMCRLFNIDTHLGITLKADLADDAPTIGSIVEIFAGADWHEREVFDLSGVRFVGHPDLRRILCPEDWEGYPLRKDYEMPLEYHGIRGR